MFECFWIVGADSHDICHTNQRSSRFWHHRAFVSHPTKIVLGWDLLPTPPTPPPLPTRPQPSARNLAILELASLSKRYYNYWLNVYISLRPISSCIMLFSTFSLISLCTILSQHFLQDRNTTHTFASHTPAGSFQTPARALSPPTRQTTVWNKERSRQISILMRDL